jgi:Resolvase, N terminal domain
VNAAKKAASADFAKLVEMFNEHGVPFVSVTQCFNITTGMGRLTLNVLLSFAHFERNFSLWSSIGAALACARRGRPADWRPLGWRCGRGGRTDAASVFDLGAPRDIAQAARHAVNDLEDGEAWPEEGLAHRELDMVQSRLNDLMLRNAPARVARGRQRRDPRAQAETTAVFAPMAGTFVPGPDQVLRLVGFKPDLGQRPPSGLYNSPAFLLRTSSAARFARLFLNSEDAVETYNAFVHRRISSSQAAEAWQPANRLARCEGPAHHGHETAARYRGLHVQTCRRQRADRGPCALDHFGQNSAQPPRDGFLERAADLRNLARHVQPAQGQERIERS